MAAPRLAFGKNRRLRRTIEFALVKKEGRTERGSLLLLGFKAGDGEKGFRAGFVTSKRVGPAVTRNRIRRRLREIVRRHQAEIRDGICLVVIARRAAAKASYLALEDEWLRLAKRASILAP